MRFFHLYQNSARNPSNCSITIPHGLELQPCTTARSHCRAFIIPASTNGPEMGPSSYSPVPLTLPPLALLLLPGPSRKEERRGASGSRGGARLSSSGAPSGAERRHRRLLLKKRRSGGSRRSGTASRRRERGGRAGGPEAGAEVGARLPEARVLASGEPGLRGRRK